MKPEDTSEKGLYETLIRALGEMGEGVSITDGSRFVYVNDALPLMYGYSREELMAMNSFLDIVAPDEKDKLIERLGKRLVGSNASDSGETVVIHKSGKRINIEYSLKPITHTNPGRLIAVIRDVTQKKQTEAVLRDEKMRAERAEMARNISEMFLTNISHELRTPMNAIIGFAGILENTPLSDEQRKQVWIIKRSGENLLVIINDLLDLSRLQEGKFQLDRKDLRIPEVVHNSLEMLSATATNKGILLESDIDPRLDLLLVGDSIRLGQIFVNLLSNALKFTNKGSIKVSCVMLDEQPGFVEAGFTVADTGIGIPIEELPYVFDRFGKTGNASWKKHEGTGIGLAISRHLVELQGGEIAVHSTVNEGTSFHFTLRFEKAASAKPARQIAEKKVATEKITERSVSLLLVEDNDMNRELIRVLCNRWSFTMDEAENGSIAIEKLKENNYDIILMDLKMPVLDGYETTYQLRRMEKWKDTPIIAFTAHAVEGEKQKCMDAGMNEYVTKPFQPNELHEKILACLEGKRPV